MLPSDLIVGQIYLFMDPYFNMPASAEIKLIYVGYKNIVLFPYIFMGIDAEIMPLTLSEVEILIQI